MNGAELEKEIRGFISSQGESSDYDFVQVVHFVIAALENINENALDAELDDIANCLSELQRDIYLKLAYRIESQTTNKEPLKTVYVPPQSEVDISTATKLIDACSLNTTATKLQRMLCDGRTTNLVEHLKPRFLAQYLSKLESIDIEYRVKHTDN